MLVGRIAQLRLFKVEEFMLNYEGTPFESVENTKYISINSEISQGFPVQRLFQNMYHLSLWGRLRRIFHGEFLHQFNESFIQLCLSCGTTLYGCSTQKYLPWSKGFRTMKLGQLPGILNASISVELALSNAWIITLSVIEESFYHICV